MRILSQRLIFRIVAVIFLAAAGLPARADSRTDATIVVFNSADPLSEELARYYAEKRGIADDQIVGLPCATTEEISREQFDQQLAEPLRQVMTERGWWDSVGGGPVTRCRIRYVALIRGIPLKIAPATAYPGDEISDSSLIGNRNEASVDSELATLGFQTKHISGALNNPYFRGYAAMADAGLPGLLLVTRLDGLTGSDIKRLIDDSLKAERQGLWGIAYFDIRGLEEGALKQGDDWLETAARLTSESGIPVVIGYGGKLFPEPYPMTNAAFYYGWYEWNITGPFLHPGFRFATGAVACHIHSFSAATLRTPGANWVGPLVHAGAAAVLGNAYEPYLGLTTHLDLFQGRLLDGFTFAEAAYMASPALSWMNVYVGDPLYRPMRLINDISAERPRTAGPWLAYRNGARSWYKDSHAAGEKRLREAAKEWKSGIILEGLASLQAGTGRTEDALATSGQARKYLEGSPDLIRVLYREASLLFGTGEKKRALEFLDDAILVHRHERHGQALIDLRNELDPPPPPPPPAAPTPTPR